MLNKIIVVITNSSVCENEVRERVEQPANNVGLRNSYMFNILYYNNFYFLILCIINTLESSRYKNKY